MVLYGSLRELVTAFEVGAVPSDSVLIISNGTCTVDVDGVTVYEDRLESALAEALTLLGLPHRKGRRIRDSE
jgi:hypothetical protein